MVQTFDLVRSEVEKKEVEEGEDLMIAAAGARGVSLNTDEYRELYRKIEADMIEEMQRNIVEAEVRERAEIAVDEKLKLGNVDPRKGSITVIHEAPAVVERTGGIVGFFKSILFGKPVEPEGKKRRGRNNKRREKPRQQSKERGGNKNRSSKRGARTRPAPVTDSGSPEQRRQLLIRKVRQPSLAHRHAAGVEVGVGGDVGVHLRQEPKV